MDTNKTAVSPGFEAVDRRVNAHTKVTTVTKVIEGLMKRRD
jgi:hypothetical protein